MSDRLGSLVAGDGQRLVLVHGFTQTARCWGPFADSLVAEGWQLVAVDAPGHGRSGSIDADVPHAAQLIGAIGGPAVYVGYSMGARMVLRLALDRPELVRAIVLVGVSPGIEDAAERATRLVSDHALADRIEGIGVDAFVEEWLQNPLFATLPAIHAFRAERRTNTPGGLARSLRLAGTGAMEPMWSRLGDIHTPTLLLTGALDRKFSDIAQRMVERMSPYGWAMEVPGAGHSVHLEHPAVAAHAVNSWLQAVVDGR